MVCEEGVALGDSVETVTKLEDAKLTFTVNKVEPPKGYEFRDKPKKDENKVDCGNSGPRFPEKSHPKQHTKCNKLRLNRINFGNLYLFVTALVHTG